MLKWLQKFARPSGVTREYDPEELRRQDLRAGQVDGRAGSPGDARIPSWMTSTPQWPVPGLARFRQAYDASEPYRASVDLITDSFNQGRMQVIKESTRAEVKRHPLPAMVCTPAGEVRSGNHRWKLTLQDLYSSGNAYWEKIREPAVVMVQGRLQLGPVVALRRLDPANVRIQLDGQGIQSYLYDIGEKIWTIPADDVVQWLFPHPSQPWFGVPPILSAHKALAIDEDLMGQMKLTLQNRGTPSTILQATDPKRTIDVSQAEQAISFWHKMTRRRRFGSTAVVPGGMEAKVLGMNWKDMDLTGAIAVPEGRIAQVHRTPTILLGRSGTGTDPTRANYEAANRQFWYMTIMSLQGDIAEMMTTYVLPEFSPHRGFVVVFCNRQVPTIQAARLERLELVGKIYMTGVVSRHRAQEIAGEEIHGPDEFASAPRAGAPASDETDDPPPMDGVEGEETEVDTT